jgi:hydroxypyruvate isomerase
VVSVDRRDFVKSAALGVAAAAVPSGVAGAAVQPASADGARAWGLRYAPHFGMFRAHAGGNDVVAELEFMASEGFTALEDNGMKGREVAVQERIAQTMTRLNMAMGVFVAHTIGWNDANLTSGNAEKREVFLREIRESVEVAKRVNARWMTVVPGLMDGRLPLEYQTANVVETLKRASAILEPHGLVMVLEPLNTIRDHPGQFLQRVPQTYLICKAVASPSCKILFDVYHQQITEGNLIPNMDRAWDEVAYIQTGDNPGRKEPTTGEINYLNVFRHLKAKGFTGIVGMEHGNARPGREGERAVIDAYRSVDG